MRFLDKETGKPLVPDVVNIHYYWLWVEYPYPAHASGVWSDAEDWVKCATGGQAELIVPAHIVKPVGWYDGKYTRFPYTLTGSRRPKFDRLEIVVESHRPTQRLIIKRSELSRYTDTTVVLKLPNAGLLEVEFGNRE